MSLRGGNRWSPDRRRPAEAHSTTTSLPLQAKPRHGWVSIPGVRCTSVNPTSARYSVHGCSPSSATTPTTTPKRARAKFCGHEPDHPRLEGKAVDQTRGSWRAVEHVEIATLEWVEARPHRRHWREVQLRDDHLPGTSADKERPCSASDGVGPRPSPKPPATRVGAPNLTYSAPLEPAVCSEKIWTGSRTQRFHLRWKALASTPHGVEWQCHKTPHDEGRRASGAERRTS